MVKVNKGCCVGQENEGGGDCRTALYDGSPLQHRLLLWTERRFTAALFKDLLIC